MPQIITNLTTIQHNLNIINELASTWNFQWLPVLKMVASYNPIKNLLKENGYSYFGIADIDEHLCFNTPINPQENIYINIAPSLRAKEIVQRFQRSSASSPETLLALEKAAKEENMQHSVLLMLDLGDGREGVPLDEKFFSLITFIKHTNFQHIKFIGVGVTLGCLTGLCPDSTIMQKLIYALKDIQHILSTPTPIISLGGTIFWNWFALNHISFTKQLQNIGSWKIELRMGDPLLVGFDIYRNQPLIGGNFKQDIFEIHAQILEIFKKSPYKNGTYVTNGHGSIFNTILAQTKTQALVDCGTLHTEVTELIPTMQNISLITHSGNYTILDISNCNSSLSQGNIIKFKPGYWAVAKSFRTPQTIKNIIY